MKVNVYYPDDMQELEDKLIDFLTDRAIKKVTPEEIDLILSVYENEGGDTEE